MYNQGDRGLLSLGIMILCVEPGRWGVFVSRNIDSRFRTRKTGGGHLSLETIILSVEPGRQEGGGGGE